MSAAPHAVPAAKWDVIPLRVIERVRDHVAMGANGCWLSTYSIANHGYAQVGWNEDGERWVTLCHRVVWIAEYGPIQEGWTIDHLCRTRRCMRVDHLRLMPNLENARRTSGRDWEVGGCVRGHPDAQYWRPAGPDRKRGYCSACNAEDQAAYQARKRSGMETWRRAKRTSTGSKRPCRRIDRGEN